MSERPRYHRKRLLVEPAYQLSLFLKLLGTIVAVGLISAFLAVAIVMRSLFRPEVTEQPLLHGAFIGIILALFITLIIAIPIAYYLGLRQSHRVIGPLGRILRSLEAIGRGDATNGLSLRKSDVLKTIEGAINQLARDLERRLQKPPRSE
jgi:hypothetical protein